MANIVAKSLQSILLCMVLACLAFPQQSLINIGEAVAASPKKPVYRPKVTKQKIVKPSQKTKVRKTGKATKGKDAISSGKKAKTQRQTVRKKKAPIKSSIQKKADNLYQKVKKAFNESAPLPYKRGFVKTFTTNKKEIYYRVYSGKADKGYWLVKTPPKSSAYAREALNLPPGNRATMIQKVIVPKDIQLERSRAVGGGLHGKRGGGEQFRILPGQGNKGIVYKKGVPLK